MRRVLIVIVLASFHATSLEAVAGLARDGAVHHETAAAAVSHSAQGQGEHGHEAASEAPGTEHGPGHQHGTGADHCTHAHGAALFGPSPALTVASVGTIPTVLLDWTPADHVDPPLPHPPRI